MSETRRFCELECDVDSFSYLLTDMADWPYFDGSGPDRPIPEWEVWPGIKGLPDVLGGVRHVIVAQAPVAERLTSLIPGEFQHKVAFEVAGVRFDLLAPTTYIEPDAYELIEPLIIDGRVLTHEGVLMTKPMNGFCARLRSEPNTIVYEPDAVATLDGRGYRFAPSRGYALF